MKLPKIIPIFPLSNFIVFPKTAVPLNIFEPRYLEMVNESMKTEKFIGMVQPKTMKNFENVFLKNYQDLNFSFLDYLINYKNHIYMNYLYLRHKIYIYFFNYFYFKFFVK